MPLVCPDCGSDLQSTVFNDLFLDACAVCGGVWLDKGEIARLRKIPSSEIRDLEEEVKPTVGTGTPRAHNPLCPVCHQPLTSFNYAGGPIQLETCRSLCGLWLEDRELDALAKLQDVPLEVSQIVTEYEMKSRATLQKAERAARLMTHLVRRRGWPISRSGW